MLHILRRLLCLLLCLLMPMTALAETMPSAEDLLAAAFRRYSTMGACVAVFENGEVTYTYTYGTRTNGGEPVTEDTLFQVGSISKMVANMGLLQLMEAKSIPLDAEIGSVLGYEVRHPVYKSLPVTLRQLMTHTAALRDSHLYNNALSGDGEPLEKLLTRQRNFTFFSGYKPGHRRQYSNFGGGLIGSLIEKLSAQTLDDYMQEHVFAPLDITAAFQPSRFAEDAPFADLYHMPKKKLAKRLSDDVTCVETPDPERHYFLTAGKLVISAPDLCKLLIALCDGGVCGNTRLLKESTVEEMLTVQNHRGSVSCKSGHGLFVNIIENDQVEGRTLYGHGGKAHGMLCAAYFDPTDRTGVVMLTNGCKNESMHNNVGMLGRQILSICYEHIIDPTHETEDPFAVE